MDSRRFDNFARTVAASPQTRRTALRRLTGGLGAALATVGLVAPRATQAQEATPAASPAAAGAHTEFLYIQTFTSGTFTPKEDDPGVYSLVLLGGTDHMTYFADRPERQVGIAPVGRALTALNFAADPPNAGLVAQTPDGERVIILELTNPVRDEATETMTYDARPLADYDGAGLNHLAAKHSDEDLPAAFGAASLFIDGAGCPYPICGGICCDASQGMVCQGNGAYCTSVYQSGVCQGGNACAQGPLHTCNPAGTCFCGTDIEGGGACVAGVSDICSRRACSTSGDCAYGKLCLNAPCCGSGAQVCMPLCQD